MTKVTLKGYIIDEHKVYCKHLIPHVRVTCESESSPRNVIGSVAYRIEVSSPTNSLVFPNWAISFKL